MPDLSAWQWAIGALCAFSVGVAKTGLPGAATFVVPTLVLMVGDARYAAGWLLPLLCVGDSFAVLYWRRHAHVKRLARLVPWVVVGMGIGAVALFLPEGILRKMVAVIILAMLALYLRGRLRPETMTGTTHASPYGIAAGFATTVANAAGPATYLYLLSMRLPKHEFIGTGAWFFFVINLSKIPIYQWHGLFTRQSLGFDAAMFPVTIMGAVTGRWLFEHIPQKLFERIVVVVTLVATLALLR